MWTTLTELKKSLALHPKQYSPKSAARFAKAQFEKELTRRYKQFYYSWNMQLTKNCKTYIRTCSDSTVYSEPFRVCIDGTPIEIKKSDCELKTSDTIQEQLQNLLKRYAQFKHFLIECRALIEEAKT